MSKPSSDIESLPKPISQIEVKSVKCSCCGFTEECTLPYIHQVQARYHGHWICGLCIEAVKEEVMRSETLISIEEALHRHMSFHNKFRSLTPDSETEHPISVMGRILRRSLDSRTRAFRSNSSSALFSIDKVRNKTLARSESCLPGFNLI